MKHLLFALLFILTLFPMHGTTISSVQKLNSTTVEIKFQDGNRLLADFYGPNIFRLFLDPNGGILRNPESNPPAQILVTDPRRKVGTLTVKNEGQNVIVSTEKIQVTFSQTDALMTVKDLTTNKVTIQQISPVEFGKNSVTLTLAEQPDEYFYGGGIQNGRFSHKGTRILIENTNNWTDGGVASPTPFYWSTAGYGVMPYTFKKGRYDFGKTKKGNVTIEHDTQYLDCFFMVSPTAVALLNDFYQLTGNPILLPKFGFYEGHLNAYNRDYFKKANNGPMKYEDGNYYAESQKKPEGESTRESLNGEFNNYIFSARAAIDRYVNNDMPLGWFLPNDGYGAGYGQTESLDGNIENLRQFGNYARSKGVEIGLWTQSTLHPKAGVEPLLQRDIVKEIRDAGVRLLKTDVAWVGAGYSFGLNGISDVGELMPYYGKNARPFIISLDGWAGTQRYAGIWTGDQTGGKWEYIRFHIPTFIGSGLSGQPNITNDVDGIFGGKNIPINVREFQWKTFTPMELNMDGWAPNAKYPHILGEPATSINRMYLKLKAELIPYTYSIAREAVDGKPMIRAMFLDDPSAYTHGKATEYQYLYGPYFLVAPIYKETQADTSGNDIRDGIYLPKGLWIDYFSGEAYEGGKILNNYAAPLWKLPVLVKAGAIIPMTNPNNNPGEIRKDYRAYELYPAGKSEFTEYDDDGYTNAYRDSAFTTTKLALSEENGKVVFDIDPTTGDFDGFNPQKETEVRLNVTSQPKSLKVRIGKKSINLQKVETEDEFNHGTNVWYYNPAPRINRFATKGTPTAEMKLAKNPICYAKVEKTDVTKNKMSFTISGYAFDTSNRMLTKSGTLQAPTTQITEEGTHPTSLTPSWKAQENADYYEVEFQGMNYSTIKNTSLAFGDLKPETSYSFKVRSVNKDGQSAWAELQGTTKKDPLEFVLHNVTGETTCKNQGGQGVNKLFDFDETNIWHTAWGAKATPFDLIADLHALAKLDKFHYLSRQGNGALLKGSVSISDDKSEWTEVGSFEWENKEMTREFTFKNNPTARYIKIHVEKGVGDFGSGKELYIFRVPDSELLLPGDINRDKRVDENDLTSYMNYTGLRKGDADFDYVSIGDLNKNGLIDAYDISNVATQLEDGVWPGRDLPIAGTLTVKPMRQNYNAGETIEIAVKGNGLTSVNALSFALPYNPQDMEYQGCELSESVKNMKNLTYDRLHTNGIKALYPTFVNIGDQATINGDQNLLTIKFKVKRSVKLQLKPTDFILVDKRLNQKKF